MKKILWHNVTLNKCYNGICARARTHTQYIISFIVELETQMLQKKLSVIKRQNLHPCRYQWLNIFNKGRKISHQQIFVIFCIDNLSVTSLPLIKIVGY